MADEIWTGAAKKIDDIDLPRIGHRIGVGEDEIHAVIDVEAGNGNGFDKEGRLKVLFEPHIFWRELGPGEKRDTAARTTVGGRPLAYSSWRRSYPSDSYPSIRAACEIDQSAALRSCSWGMGQMMGFNHKICGYATVEDMVEAFADDEDAQLEAMVVFIEENNLDDELRRHDWSGFARGYNGAGYKANRYDTKLARAYAKWSEIPDTPWEGPTSDGNDRVPELEFEYSQGDRNDKLKAWQRSLTSLEYYRSDIDGIFGPAMASAVKKFQSDHGLQVDGVLGQKTANAIDNSVAKEKRQNAQLSAIRESADRIIEAVGVMENG